MMDSTLSPARGIVPVTIGTLPMGRTSRMVSGALLLSLSCVLGLVEASFATPLAGARLGLANIAIVVALGILGEAPALAIAISRVVIVGLATGSIFGPTSALAFAGAFAAWCAMTVALRSPFKFSYVGISVCGAVTHVIAQYAVASVLTGVTGVLFLAPIAVAMSLVFGIVTGYLARYIISRVEVSHPSGR